MEYSGTSLSDIFKNAIKHNYNRRGVNVKDGAGWRLDSQMVGFNNPYFHALAFSKCGGIDVYCMVATPL